MTLGATATFFAKVTSFSFLVGALIAVFLTAGPLDARSLFVGGLNGAFIGLGCSVVEIEVLSNRSIRWLRKVPLIVLVVMRTGAFCLIIFFGLTVPSFLILGTRVWLDPNFLFSFWLSTGVAIAISTAIELMQLLGREATISIFTGRYRRPRHEDRIVMFADLIGSTALAEKLGDLRFHELLGDVSYDLSEPIGQTGGETHRYVGDAVIITWPMQRPSNFEQSVACAIGMQDVLAQEADTYIARYGQAMEIRIALHAGPVAAGEVGTWKKEIALLGDTMNTAARIETAARDFGVGIVVSDTVRQRLPQSVQETLVRMPDYSARGKHESLRLWAIENPKAARQPM